VALGVAIAGVGRAIFHALADIRPLQGWEAADAQRAMHYHYGLRGHLDWTWFEQVARDGFKPPLWYGGVPLLVGWRDTMRVADFLLVNAAMLAVTLALVWAVVRRLADERAAAWAVVLVVALPGIAGRITRVGVESTHMAALVGVLLLLERGHRHPRSRGVGLGLLVGAATLAKWNFLAYVAPLLVWEVLSARRRSGDSMRSAAIRMGTTIGITVALLLAWLLPFGDPGEILAQSQRESSAGGALGTLGFYLRNLVQPSLGPVGIPLVGVGVLALAVRSRDGTTAGSRWELLPYGLAAVSILGVHAMIPHTEGRYLVPLLAVLAVPAAVGLARLEDTSRWVAGPLRVAGIALFVTTLVVPAFEDYGDQLHERELVSQAVRHDFGLDALARHASFGTRHRSVVTYSITEGPEFFPLLSAIRWRLYDRNAAPVLSRSSWPDVRSDESQYSLERSTHFVTDRVLAPAETEALRAAGFEPAASIATRISGWPTLELWARPDGVEPPYR
jgi:hypothetical protein